jgi:GNAT superfamily N-acetyltransferase
VVSLESIDIRNASDATFGAITALRNRLRAEEKPNDPPIPAEEQATRFRNAPDFVFLFMWLAWAPGGGELWAEGTLEGFREGENTHLGQMNIIVQPERRRQGLARQLLAEIVTSAAAQGRHTLVARTTDRVPAGAAFMQRLGANPGLASHTNQLDLGDLDRDLVQTWQARATERASGFELGLWDGPFPEEQIEAIARLYDVMNDAPLGDLDVKDIHLTPAELRQIESSMFGAGTRRWVLYIRERATGRLAGFTVVAWHPNRAAFLSQGDTGVFPEYRGLGLGRWLKAAMLAKVLTELPAVRYVRTGNADSNAAMLKINHELGFKPYIAETIWQVPTETVQAYVDGN